MDWSEASALLANARAVWQDLDGVHVAPLPAEAPLTSIVWAWDADESNWAARVRIDDPGSVYVHKVAWPREVEYRLQRISATDGVHAVRGPGADEIKTSVFWSVDLDGVSFIRGEQR